MVNDLTHDLQNARPIDFARERVEELASKAAAWDAANLSDKDNAAQAADYFNQVRGEKQRLKDERKAEKAPALQQGRAVDKIYAEVAALLDNPWEIISRKVTEVLQARKAAGETPSLRGNYSSRAIALKSIWRTEIADPLQLYLYYADNPKVLEVLQQLADAEASAAHREGREIPGARLIEKEIAA